LTFPKYEDFMDAIFETDIIIKEQQEEMVLLHRWGLSEPKRFSVKTLSKNEVPQDCFLYKKVMKNIYNFLINY